MAFLPLDSSRGSAGDGPAQLVLDETTVEPGPPDPEISTAKDLGKRSRLRRLQPTLLVSWLVVAVVVVWAILPSWFTSFPATSGIAKQKLQAPNSVHLFGTDQLGRDVLARVIYGASQSVTGALVAVGVGLLVGTLLGLIAGSVGGVIDSIIMRIVDVLLAIPSLLLSLSIVIVLGFGTVNAAIAVGVAAVAAFSRLTRSEVIRVRRSDYVEAAFGSGGTFAKVLWRHILPNSVGPIIALAALQFGAAIMAIATLGYLGYGAKAPTPEWGLMIAEGRNYIATSWWLTSLPGVVVVVVVLSANRISRSINRSSR